MEKFTGLMKNCQGCSLQTVSPAESAALSAGEEDVGRQKPPSAGDAMREPGPDCPARF